MRPLPAALLALALLAPASHAQVVINFEDLLAAFPASQYDLSNPVYGEFYADLGMTMSATELVHFGDGVSNNDVGNWDVDGTNGPAFIALYDPNPGGTLVLAFNSTVNLTIDLITNKVSPGGVPVNVMGLRDGKVVVNVDLHLAAAPPGDPDGLAHPQSFERIDQIQFTLTGPTQRALAFDNIAFEPAGDCNPADFNKDGVLDFFDIAIFLSFFSAGCP